MCETLNGKAAPPSESYLLFGLRFILLILSDFKQGEENDNMFPFPYWL